MAALLFLGGAFSLQTGANANHLLARIVSRLGDSATGPKIGQKTRPSTQYTVNDLASPGY
jgi:hypothetical protein